MEKPSIKKNDDGSVEILLSLSPDDLRELEADLADPAAAGKKKYCCFCHDNHQYEEIKAWNSVEAAVRCGLTCGGGYTMSKGECNE